MGSVGRWARGNPGIPTRLGKSHRRRKFARICITVSCILLTASLAAGPAAAVKKKSAQTKKKKTEPRAVLLVPPEYRKSRSYPVLTVLPYTGGTARNFLEFYLFSEFNPRRSMQRKWVKTLRTRYPNRAVRRERSYFILVPFGKGTSRDHSARGFANAMLRYEKRINRGLTRAARKYPIDRRRVVLAGHSLGGDLTWALTLRSPRRYIGAVVSGSRTSYPENGRLKLLGKRNFRYFFSMGELERRDRLMGLSRNLYKLYRSGVNYRVYKAPGVGHKPPSRAGLFKAIEFAMFGSAKKGTSKIKRRRTEPKRTGPHRAEPQRTGPRRATGG